VGETEIFMRAGPSCGGLRRVRRRVRRLRPYYFPDLSGVSDADEQAAIRQGSYSPGGSSTRTATDRSAHQQIAAAAATRDCWRYG